MEHVTGPGREPIALVVDSTDKEGPTAAPRTGPSVRAARMLLWLAIVLPFIYTTRKTASEVASGGLGAWDMVRGAGPVVLLAVSVVMAPVRRRGFGWVEVALAGYCGVALLSVVVPSNPAPSVSLMKAASLAFVALAGARLVRMYREPSEVIVALTGFVHLVLLAGAVQLLIFRSTVYAVATGPLSGTSDGLARLNLVVPQVSANPLALVGVAGIISCVVGVGPRWLPFNVVTRNGLLVLYGYLIFLTRTRSALLVGVAIVLVALLVRARRKPLSSLAIFAALCAAAVTIIPDLLPAIHTFFQRGQTRQGIDTLSGRTVIWTAAKHVWEQNRAFGLGYYTGHRLGIPGINAEQSNIDNTWLETLVDTGVAGCLPLALFAIGGYLRLVRARGLRGDVRLWAGAVAAYTLLISFVNPTIQSPGAGQVVLLVLLLAVFPPTTKVPH